LDEGINCIDFATIYEPDPIAEEEEEGERRERRERLAREILRIRGKGSITKTS
jgi:hypothetical protein